MVIKWGMSQKLNFSLTQIEYVMAVYKHGHFAKAAEACLVTQPTLSMQIKKLEDDIGAPIFDRSKKPILLTETGKALIGQLQTLLYEAKKVESIVQAAHETKMQGELTVGVIPTVAPYLLPGLFSTASRSKTELRLDVREMQTFRIIEALESDEIDVGILALPLALPKVFEVPLYFEPFCVACRSDHELATLKKVKTGQLKYSDIWLLEEGHCMRNQTLDVCSLKKPSERKFKFESGSLETLKNIVQSYGGYTLLPAMATENVESKTRVIPFERPIPSRQVGLAYRREHYKSDLIDHLGELVLESLPEEIRKLRARDLEVLNI